MSDMFALMAYINPGTGSLFWQILLVGIAGATVSVRTWSQWIKDRFSRRKSTKPPQEPDGR